VFPEYISDRFGERRKAIEAALSDPDSPNYIPNQARRLPAKYDYPPDHEERVIDLVLQQAELFAANGSN
jgi:hypothetical protein